MKQVILVAGIFASAVSGVIAGVGGVMYLLDGDATSGFTGLLLAMPMAFSMSIVFAYVLNRVAEDGEESGTGRAAGDARGTPWAKDSGHER